MQDDSNLRHPPKNKISAKKQYFTINFIHLIHKACQILIYLYQLVSLSPSSQSVLSSSLHSLLISPSSSLSFHIYHHQSVPSIALDIQQFLKPFTITFGEMQCHATLTRYYSYVSCFISLLEAIKIPNFLHGWC